MEAFDQESFKQEIESGFSKASPEKMIQFAKNIGKEVTKENLTSSQLRKFYNVVKGIDQKVKGEGNLEEKYLAELIFLKPHLEYAYTKRKIPAKFKNVMEISIDSKYLQRIIDFKYFVKFFEAIVAYHNVPDQKNSGGR